MLPKLLSEYQTAVRLAVILGLRPIFMPFHLVFEWRLDTRIGRIHCQKKLNKLPNAEDSDCLSRLCHRLPRQYLLRQSVLLHGSALSKVHTAHYPIDDMTLEPCLAISTGHYSRPRLQSAVHKRCNSVASIRQLGAERCTWRSPYISGL
jgi:hypothetical protein